MTRLHSRNVVYLDYRDTRDLLDAIYDAQVAINTQHDQDGPHPDLAGRDKRLNDLMDRLNDHLNHLTSLGNLVMNTDPT